MSHLLFNPFGLSSAQTTTASRQEVDDRAPPPPSSPAVSRLGAALSLPSLLQLSAALSLPSLLQPGAALSHALPQPGPHPAWCSSAVVALVPRRAPSG
ncbi:hypothetical protein U9M48_013952 [Paspalum notatum var. saurae]|uniref:Uncharacterized protein n=1 Tax=Paspalum notatum var. saurae TaxID=547442 RepID=A0AAQ3T378_PASNO